MKLRKKTQTIISHGKVMAWYCIEINQGGGWTLLGNQEGLYKFSSKQDRDDKMEFIAKSLGIRPKAKEVKRVKRTPDYFPDSQFD
jgi:hypothetical protein